MKLVRSKTYEVNGRTITMERYEGKRRSHGKWVDCKVSYTTIEGLKNINFFMENDFGNRYATFSIETLNEEERKIIANGKEELLAIKDDCELVCKSGILEDIEVAYSDWYGVKF